MKDQRNPIVNGFLFRSLFASLLLGGLIAALVFAVHLTRNGDTAIASDMAPASAPQALSPLDTDGDGFADSVESALGSLPAAASSTPEHASLPLTCGDGVDNDGDGFTDFDGGDTGCTADSDSDGLPDMVEVEFGSKPFVAIGAGSVTEDIFFDSSLVAECGDFVDNDGDSTTDGTGFLPPDDFGCIDSDSDGFSDERELAHGSNPGSGASTPENLLSIPSATYYPSATHVCLDGLDNDGDGLTDLDDDSCRIVLRMDMNTLAAPANVGVQVCRPMPASVGIGATIEIVIENMPPMFGMDAVILYDLARISGVTTKAAESTFPPPGGHPNFYRKFDPSITVFNGSEDFETGVAGANPSDGVYSTFLGDLGLTGPYGIGTQFQNTTLGGAGLGGGIGRFGVTTIGGQVSGTVTNVEFDRATLVIRDVANGTVVDDIADDPSLPGGILAHNPLSVFDGMFQFLTSPSACSGAATADGDGDAVPDLKDNCPGAFNPAQADDDFDGTGNACEVVEVEADVALTQFVELGVVYVGPADLQVSEDGTVIVTKTITNNGPTTPVDVSITDTPTAPVGCTVTPNPDNATTATVTTGNPVTVTHTFIIHCTDQSEHIFTFDNEIAITTEDVTDPTPGNNTASSTLTVTVTAKADVKLSQAVLGPSALQVSENGDVTVTKTLHNNGPFGPVLVDFVASATAPVGCTATIAPNGSIISLPVSTPVDVIEFFTIHCTDESEHTFTFDNNATVIDLHVVDPDTTNNSASDTLTVIVTAKADVKLTQAVAGPSVLQVSEDGLIQVIKTLHNNGPDGPVNVDIAAVAIAPVGCTVTAAPDNATTANLPVSVPVDVIHDYDIHCTDPSEHTFNFNNDIAIADLHVVDPEPLNNTANDDLIVIVNAKADVKLTQAIAGPSALQVSEDGAVTVTKTLHNNGPFGPVNVAINPSATAPPGCTATAPAPYEIAPGLPVSTPVDIIESFIIHCTDPSEHIFTFDNDASITDLHVIDPDTTNNSASDTLTVIVTAKADVKLTQVCTPGSVPVSDTATITCAKTLHNNGPFGPVTVDITATATAPAGGSVTPDPGNATSATLPVSTPVDVDEVFTITCPATAASFTFDNDATVTTLHVVDPDTTNNSTSSAVTCAEPDQADVKLSQVINGPATVQVSEDGAVTVTKALHNNGPVGPVDVDIAASAAAPVGCTVTAAPDNATSATLPVSTPVDVIHDYTIHCTDQSEHIFTFDNEIAITTGDVTDPTPGNNIASDTHIVIVNAKADVKLTQTVASPTSLQVSETGGVTVTKTLHNNGPFGPVLVDITATANAPVGCTVFVASDSIISLPVSIPVVVDEFFTIHCTDQSEHTFTFDNNATVIDLHVVDPDTTNNSASDTLTVIVTAKADVKLTQTVAGPAALQVSEDGLVTVTRTLHNNGPFGPVLVSTTSGSPAVPVGCTAGADPPAITNLPVSTPVDVIEIFTIHCTDQSEHTFTFASLTNVLDLHVIDPDTTNNSASDTLTVIVNAKADVKLTQVCTPSSVPVSTGATITCAKTLHNNGPFGPVNVDITATAAAPAGGNVTPDPLNPTSASLPVSTPVDIDELFAITCPATAASFTFDNDATVTTLHVVDPDTTTNSASSTVTCAEADQADVKLSQTVAGPASLQVSEDGAVTVTKTLHNNGPIGPVDVDISATAAAPVGCTATQDPLNATTATLPVSTPVDIIHSYTIHCTEQSEHTFTFDNEIAITPGGVTDPDTTNNSASDTLTVIINAKADVKLTQTVAGPASLQVSENGAVTVTKTLHNNGPFGPVDFAINPSATAPPGCTAAVPAPYFLVEGLPVSTPVDVIESFIIHCTDQSEHTFTFDNDATVLDLHVVDPDTTNNSASSTLTVIVNAKADVKLTQVCTPSSLPVSDTTTITCTKTLHNNGPFGPVNVDINASATAPAGGSVTPDPLNPTSATLPVSTPVDVDEIFTITCPATAASFTFDNDATVTTLHAVDPDTTNNSASSTVTCAESDQADVKLTQAVAGPAALQVSEDGAVTVTKTLHNNGPLGPVDVDIAASAAAPVGCTTTADPLNATTATLPVSTDVDVIHAYTIHCTENSEHIFTFDNDITISTADVTDPDTTNNSASDTLTVIVTAKADVKLSQTVAGPAALQISEDGTVTVSKTLHNNGPFGPVLVDITATANAPVGCTAAFVADGSIISLPVSTPVDVIESFIIHCTDPSEHIFTFDNDATVTDLHVVDPDTTNNSASDSLSVIVSISADIKIVSFDCTQTGPSTITCTKVLHNNGSIPVTVDIDVSATASGGTVSPASASSTLTLQPTEPVTVTETFSCTGAGTFTFTNTVTPSDPHIVDADGASATDPTEADCEEPEEHDVKLLKLNGPLRIKGGGTRQYIAQVKVNSPDDEIPVAILVVDPVSGCGTPTINVNDPFDITPGEPDSIAIDIDGDGILEAVAIARALNTDGQPISAGDQVEAGTAHWKVSFPTCGPDVGTPFDYFVTADACHSGDPDPKGFFTDAFGADCPITQPADGGEDLNQANDDPLTRILNDFRR